MEETSLYRSTPNNKYTRLLPWQRAHFHWSGLRHENLLGVHTLRDFLIHCRRGVRSVPFFGFCGLLQKKNVQKKRTTLFKRVVEKSSTE